VCKISANNPDSRRPAAPDADIAAVIVNYNGEPFLRRCLAALEAQTLRPRRIVVVDNASPDGSGRLVAECCPAATLIANESNEFFCRGANRGLAATTSPFVLLLNNDCILDPPYLAECVKPLLRDERVGSVTGKILRADGATIDTAGQLVSRSRKPLDRGWGQPDRGQLDEEEEVFGAGGVAPLLRRVMLEDVALDGKAFDEGFVQYYEDLDLAWRARNFGWKAWYVPSATARHQRGGAGQSEPDQRAWVRRFALANLPAGLQAHLLKNRYATMARNDRLGSWLAGLPWIAAYELKIMAYLLLMRPSLLGRYFAGFGFLRQAFAARKRLKERARQRGIIKYGGRAPRPGPGG